MTVPAVRPRKGLIASFMTLRKEIATWQAVLISALCIASCLAAWWFVTRGEAEERTLGPTVLPSPFETFSNFRALWVDRKLPDNIWASLRRVALGFALAAGIGVPLGVLCGCFKSIHAFFVPITIFGRNIPVAALIPLTFSLFGIGETQKIMFIFIACVAFIISDTASAISDVGSSYIDTALSLGAGRWHIIIKVLVPLALPSIFNSLRLLFGLAFGYIMLAELIKFGGESGGLGDIIITSQRRNMKEHIILVLMIIPVVALLIDKVLFFIQRGLFPYRYGGRGQLHRVVRMTLHGWEDLKRVFWRTEPVDALAPAASADSPVKPS
jgi:ABC-type nitrate/sulfonate/bicarbonate transport system permease component